jgi:hypothetical protein
MVVHNNNDELLDSDDEILLTVSDRGLYLTLLIKNHRMKSIDFSV